jgi:DNA-binding CsgD family transcriptional regulator
MTASTHPQRPSDDDVFEPPAESEAVADLVRRLRDAALVEPRAAGSAAEMLLDVEMDGVRCTLSRSAHAPSRPLIGLTPREREVARMVAGGYANKTIARVLDISAWTVGTHLRRIFLKLDVSSRAAMVARLFEEEPRFTRQAAAVDAPAARRGELTI